jgi:hypothetical protein
VANNLAAFNSEAWSSRLVQNLDQVNIVKPLVNTDWEGDLRQNKTVQVRTPGNITMGSYAKGGVISYQDLAPVKESFTVADGQYFAFNVDDIDKAQTDLSAMDVYMRRAVVAMNNVVETKIINGLFAGTPVANQASTSSGNGGSGATGTATVSSGAVTAIAVSAGGSGYTSAKVGVVLIGGGGSGATATVTVTANAVASVTIVSGGSGYTSAPTVVFVSGDKIVLDSGTAATGIYQVFVSARTKLTKQNVPMEGRWAIVDPDTVALLLADTSHFVRSTNLGDNVVANGNLGGSGRPGFIGRCAGFDVYETPHTVQDMVGSARYLQFGDKDGLSYAAQITEIEALRLQTTFADAIRGLILHDTFVPAEAAKRLVWARVG